MLRNLILCVVLAPAIGGVAQQPAASSAKEGSNWQNVQALPAGANIEVKARKRHATCKLKSVDADTLICSQGKDVVFQRADIVTIKIPRRGRSTLIAAGIGIGVGAIVGAASGSSCTEAQKNSFFGCFLVFSRGDLALVGGTVGGVIGTPIGYFTDLSRSTVYQAP